MTRRNQTERGQVLILSVLAITVVFVVGAIAVDIGLWVSERRGSQTDADFLALSGAWELLDSNASVADVNTAVNAALTANDGELNLTLQNPPDVDLTERCVGVDVDHESTPLFFRIFGLLEPEIGAHARACAGPVSGGNLIPLQLDNDTAPCFVNEQPVLSQLCPLEFGAQGGPNGNNPRGILDLEADPGWCSNDTGDGDIENLIEWGTAGPCLINAASTCPSTHQWIDCAATQTGNPKKVLDGTAARLARDGACDTNGNGIDDFDETVILIVDNSPSGAGPEDIYGPRDCDASTDGVQMSPRIVSIIVFEEYPASNNTPYPIVGIASVYIAGCAPKDQVVNSVDDLNRDCTNPSTMTPGSLEGLFVMAPGFGPVPRPAAGHCPGPHQGPHSGPNARPCPTPTPAPTPTPPPGGPPGHIEVWGNIFKLAVGGGTGGGSGGSGTTLGIYLVE